MKQYIFKTILLFVVMLSAVSCSTPKLETVHYAVYSEKQYPVIASPSEVTVYNDIVDFEYIEIGIAEARNDTREVMLEGIKTEVSEMGGNALIDVVYRRNFIRGTVVIRK